LEREGENRFVANAEVKIGPIGARFKGNVELSDFDAPNGYVITGFGNGGIAGPAKGGARVRLLDATGGGTFVSYEVDAEVGGRMAQLGGPINDATAKNINGGFLSASLKKPPSPAAKNAWVSSLNCSARDGAKRGGGSVSRGAGGVSECAMSLHFVGSIDRRIGSGAFTGGGCREGRSAWRIVSTPLQSGQATRAREAVFRTPNPSPSSTSRSCLLMVAFV